MLALFNLESEVNIIHLTFTKKLDLFIQPSNIGAQEIDIITLNAYGIVGTAFSVTDIVN